MSEITMPRLSDSMEEGTILRWLVADGAAVARGDEIAEIETDKANMTYEADAAGVFRAVAAEGDALLVGAVIAHVLGDGEEAPASSGSVSPSVLPGTADTSTGQDTSSESADEGASPSASTSMPAVGDGSEPSTRVKVSPVARRLARELGVELASLAGSGPSGRIVKADVEAAAAEPQAAPISQTSPPPAAGGPVPSAVPAVGGTGKGEVTVVELTSTQKTIARRMAESKATVPDFQVRTEADVTDLLALRKQIKAAQETAPSVNDFVVKACGLALREHPRANGAYRDGAFELYGRANVGVAVAAEGTLIVPTIFDADTQPVTAIAQTTRALAARVRDGKILPPELSGGTFTVSNLGMFGVTSFTAVVNPGQAAILAVGAAVERPTVAADGSLAPRALMDLSLSCDHRILYGADAAQFLARVRELLQTPFALLA
ncbi:MAG TPA: dihydrolipoamide acetyltransferase family protein [Conexibacter sp.]|jgi:pyruvate dehydrogenase E2 component (dihydrolipoamide acetyltransferase)|nr:dihydrolipoamide acetyltransferase family protein [Conexibacter sp.]